MSKDEKTPLHETPVARFAHSFLWDCRQQCYYMFGGNATSGNIHTKGTSNMRLDDFWKLQVSKIFMQGYASSVCILACEAQSRESSQRMSVLHTKAKV